MHQGDFNAVASLFTLINFEQAFVVVRGLVRGANWGVDSVADFEAAILRTTFDYFGRLADSVVDQLDGGCVLLEGAAACDLQPTLVRISFAVGSTDGRPVGGTEDGAFFLDFRGCDARSFVLQVNLDAVFLEGATGSVL